MRNMTITHIFEITLRLEGEIKAGLGLRRRTLQAFPPARGAPAAPPPAKSAIKSAGHKFSALRQDMFTYHISTRCYSKTKSFRL